MKTPYYLLFAFISKISIACSCLPAPPVEEAFKECDALIYGKVIQLNLEEESHTVSAVIKVEEQFKGKREGLHLVNTAADGAACGFRFQIGGTYLIYCTGEEGALWTGACGRTKEFALKERRLDFMLGDGKYEKLMEERHFLESILEGQKGSIQSH